jgi:TonB family protein
MKSAYYLLFSIIAFSFSSLAQPKCDTIDLAVYTGTCLHYKDSVAIEIRSYAEGKPSGIWKKLNKKGDIIAARYYKVENDSLAAENQPADSNAVEETFASFPGGHKAMKKFLSTNKKYPAEAKKNCIHGIVYMSFLVDTLGNITETTVEQGIDSTSLDIEASRLISSMPTWNPATEDKKKIPMRIRMPISFTLPECK